MQLYLDTIQYNTIVHDIIIGWKDVKEHDEVLHRVMETVEKANIRFNKSKIQFKNETVRYMGHLISKERLRVDPKKVKAVRELPQTKDGGGVCCLFEIVKYLSRYIQNESTISEPLRNLLMKNSAWAWQHEHDDTLTMIKDIPSKHPALSFYDVWKEVSLQTDAS